MVFCSSNSGGKKLMLSLHITWMANGNQQYHYQPYKILLFKKEIVTLVNEENPVGSYEIEFDAINLPSGIYFYKLQVNNFIETKKMILLK
jgi:hypothetical protein